MFFPEFVKLSYCLRDGLVVGIRFSIATATPIPTPTPVIRGYRYFHMIIETIFSTLDESGAPNFAPMGVEPGPDCITVRPFRNTRTYRNLVSTGFGVVNYTDDALAYVESALYNVVLPSFPAKTSPGAVYQNACSWQELAVESETGSDARAELKCRVLYKGRQNDFIGFCRASHAVIEATIIATRLNLIGTENGISASLECGSSAAAFEQSLRRQQSCRTPKMDIVDQRMIQYREIVEKTGGDAERKAFQLVQDFITKRRRDD
jgi:uncharacterized protein